jgi:hypothetical protein
VVWLLSCSLSFSGIKQDQNTKQTKAHQLLKEICVYAYKSDVENLRENEVISQQLLVAAKVGNVEFLIEVIRMNINLLLIVDKNSRSIFHIAVEERHKSIFNILNELGSIKDLILQSRTKDDQNNILHLVAKSASQHKLNAISGAALQMQQEFLWYKVQRFLLIFSLFLLLFLLNHFIECSLIFPLSL